MILFDLCRFLKQDYKSNQTLVNQVSQNARKLTLYYNFKRTIMDTKKKEQIVLRLISNDLIQSRLILGLYKLNIDAKIYEMLGLRDIIFRLMGFNEKQLIPELLQEYFMMNMNAVNAGFNLEDTDKIKELAKGIFDTLSIKLHDARK